MGARIKITAGPIEVLATLNDSPTAQLVADALPLKAEGATWGGEVYFPVPVVAERETGARDVVEPGEVGYWPDGRCLCLFFGPTPMSEGDEVRAASPVNIVGMIEDDYHALESVPYGAAIVVESA
jgi:hypothetical protein